MEQNFYTELSREMSRLIFFKWIIRSFSINTDMLFKYYYYKFSWKVH